MLFHLVRTDMRQKFPSKCFIIIILAWMVDGQCDIWPHVGQDWEKENHNSYRSIHFPRFLGDSLAKIFVCVHFMSRSYRIVLW